MNQKLEDIKMLVKNDRRVWAVAGFMVFALIIWAATGKEPRRPRVEMEQATSQSTDPRDGYNDLTLAFRQDLERLNRQSKETEQVMKRLDADLREHKTRSTGIFETIVDRLEELGRAIDRLEEQQASVGKGAVQVEESQDSLTEPDSLEQLGFTQATVPPPPPEPKPLKVSVISPGDLVRLKLLTGVNAPVDGTPYPVVFKVISPITGPDGSALEVGEARLIAAATGSEADGRVLYRLTDLAIRHKDGRRSVVKVDGWVVGEDGIRGMKGRLIDKLGRLIVATAGVSFAAALGDRLDNRSDGIQVSNSDNVEIDASDVNVATASAFTDASNRLGQVLLDRYEKLVPVVEILSGREVSAVFSQTAEVEVFEEEDPEGIYAAALE